MSPEERQDADPVPEFKGQLKGHGLRFEGRVSTFFGMGTGPGPARCSCGTHSQPFPTTAARQRWHRQHKARIAELIDGGGVDD